MKDQHKKDDSGWYDSKPALLFQTWEQRGEKGEREYKAEHDSDIYETQICEIYAGNRTAEGFDLGRVFVFHNGTPLNFSMGASLIIIS